MIDETLRWLWKGWRAGRRPPPWWQRFPKRRSRLPRDPGPGDAPDLNLPPGTLVWLRGKPDRPRRLLRAEWHAIRCQHVYIVETSAGARFAPYWFADQLT